MEEAYSQIWSMAVGFAAAYAVKAALKLDLFNIISKAPSPKGCTLDDIVEKLKNQYEEPQPDKLHRLLRFLVLKHVLSLDMESDAPRYGLTAISKLLVSENNELFLGALFRQLSPEVWRGWDHLDAAITAPGTSNPIIKGYGMDPQQYIAEHPEFIKTNEEFRLGVSNVTFAYMMEKYDGFKQLKKLVDVGGGTGSFVANVVKAYPQIEGINFDIPHAFGPTYPGVKNVAGNAMESVPSTDGIFMKNFLHMFSDENATKIVENCYKALEKGGRVIISEMVMDENSELCLQLDVAFLAAIQRYQRTEEQWRSLLKTCGFERIQFFNSAAFSIIEAMKD